MYDRGYGVAQHYGEAEKWYREGAEQGDPNAQASLGDLYFAGLGVALLSGLIIAAFAVETFPWLGLPVGDAWLGTVAAATAVAKVGRKSRL